MTTTDHGAYQILDDDGRATFLSYFLGTHHAFRRDAARLPVALRRSATPSKPGEGPDVDALRSHWDRYRAALAYHHHMEDDSLFPQIDSIDHATSEVIDELIVQHHDMDGTIAKVEEALGLLPAFDAVEPAAQACEDLADALDLHLDLEEEHLVPVMRSNTIEPDAGDAGERDDQQEEHANPDDTGHSVRDALGRRRPGRQHRGRTGRQPAALRTARLPLWEADYIARLRRWWR